MSLDHIVDAHHHLWDLDAVHYPWLMEKGVKRFFGDPAPIQKNYLLDDLQQDIGTLPIKKSVHIQVGAMDGLQEHNWVAGISAAKGMPSALISFADMTSAHISQTLDHMAHSPMFRGVRQILGRSDAEDKQTGTASLIHNPDFLSGLKTLARRQLSFDLQLIPSQMKLVADILEQVPDLHVALCHAGSLSDFSQAGVEIWQKGLRSLAKHPNIICKISGFGMFNHTWRTADIKGYILTAIDIFGPQRIAFGSNFPVDKLYSTYDQLWYAYLEITAQFSDPERRAMFAETAERFYKI